MQILLLSFATIAGGCSDIGKINGVNISRVAGENPNDTYCEANTTTCILAGALVVGGTALVIHEVTKGSSSSAPEQQVIFEN